MIFIYFNESQKRFYVIFFLDVFKSSIIIELLKTFNILIFRVLSTKVNAWAKKWLLM